MRIVINASTMVGSGVTQVSTSFIYECLAFEDNNEYHVFMSESVSNSIVKKDFDSRFKFYDFKYKPIPFSLNGIKSIFKIKSIVKNIKPEIVFSIFGPSWWSPNCPHIQGYAYPYYVYPESPFLKSLSPLGKFKVFFSKKIHLFFFKRNGNYFVSETTDVSDRLRKLLNSKNKKFYTVSNTCNSFFRNFKNDNRIKFFPEKECNEFRFISLCTLQPHKNLEILNKVIPILEEKGYNKIKFILTISDDELKKKFNPNVQKYISAIGRILPKDCPYLFNECDALFLPTLTECFTANYPEAMILEKPILTSNLSFATSICKDSALYFNPTDEFDISNRIIELVNNKDLQNSLINNGKKILSQFLTPDERAKEYLRISYLIINEK
ncbi:glycosyltransferase [Flavobacterium columnare]|uniref:Glycosyltransferase n=1 Tax=Flavobacterium columnare TaxID=996 RepID=A0A437UDY4_9FLAO|nr:glycosyltransferase [Flavobacterium columnare]RVU91801.1 glycosyltransferase [Flavobacterium columnare]